MIERDVPSNFDENGNLMPRRYLLLADSLHDAISWIDATPVKWSMGSGLTTSRSAARREWDLGVGWDGARRLAYDGWSIGALEMYERLNVVHPATTTHFETKYDVGGFYPDVGRFAGGLPDHMVTRGRVKHQRPVLSLVLNMVGAANVSAQSFLNFGTAVCATIDKLEAAGQRVELSVVFAVNYQPGNAFVGWKVKAPGEALDLASTAFAIAHPAAFRRIGFALLERLPRNWEQANYGSAYTYFHLAKHGRSVLYEFEDALLIHGAGGRNFASVDEALAYLGKQLEKHDAD